MAEIDGKIVMKQEITVIGDAVDLEMEEITKRIRESEIYSDKIYLANLMGMKDVVDYFQGKDNAGDLSVRNIIKRGRERFANAKQIIENRPSLAESEDKSDRGWLGHDPTYG